MNTDKSGGECSVQKDCDFIHLIIVSLIALTWVFLVFLAIRITKLEKNSIHPIRVNPCSSVVQPSSSSPTSNL